MSLTFGNAKVKTSTKEKTPSYKIVNGENVVRFVGGILPRYVYWVPNKDGTKSPVECLRFNREEEKWDDKAVDPVQEMYPDLKPEWAYVSLILDSKAGAILLFNHKKKLLMGVQEMVDDLGDPADPDKGWDLVFTRAKTGPKVFNVEYTIKQLRCKTRPLTAEEREIVAAYGKTIDEVLPRPTEEAIRKFLEDIRVEAVSGSDKVDEEIPAGDFDN